MRRLKRRKVNREVIMACFALTLSRQGFDPDHIGECLTNIDRLMNDISTGAATIDDYMKELEHEDVML